MNGFNPEMLKYMNPSLLRQSADMINGMSDDQLRIYLNNMGMGHISPQSYRNMSANLKNMSDDDLERMKNNPSVKNNINKNLNNQNNPTEKPKMNKSANLEYEKVPVLNRLDNIKSEGNEMFRNGKYSEACDRYHEVLNEISYLSEKEKNLYRDKLDELEILCRLNIANVKLKNNDYEYVIRECAKVLKKNDTNFKAHYRSGVGYYKINNYSKASFHFNRARDINKNEEKNQIDEYLKECNKYIATNEDSKVDQESFIQKEENKNEEKLKCSKRDKIKEIFENDIKEPHKKNEDITIEEVNKINKENIINNLNNQTTNNVPNIDKEKLNQAKSQILNMSDDQLNGIADTMKNMDNDTIKNMMKMQGMEITDDQINLMRNNINTDLFKTIAKNSDLLENVGRSNTNKCNLNNENIESNVTTQKSTSSIPTMPGNMDMSSMLSFVQNNPQLLNMMGPQVSKMFGKDGNDPNMIKAIENIIWLMSLPQRIKAFFSSTRGKLIILAIIVLFITYLYK